MSILKNIEWVFVAAAVAAMVISNVVSAPAGGQMPAQKPVADVMAGEGTMAVVHVVGKRPSAKEKTASGQG